jgi:dTDP-4-dehydrorhamnose 3,5-epimerase
VEFVRTAIPDVVLIRPRVYGDARGFFLESWEERKFAAAGIDARFVQDNHSRSARGVLRGLHYQIMQPQGKLVRVVRGAVFDVAVDIRRTSPCFGRWVATELSVRNHQMLWVPPGFANGFLTLTESVDFIYRCTDFYAPQHERTILWNDADLGIGWPLERSGEPILSAKDAAGVPFRSAECFP